MHTYNLNLQIPPNTIGLEHNDAIVFAGSCFAENISHKLEKLLFNCIKNPNGIVFNPISLAVPFKKLIENKNYTENDLILQNNTWVSLHHHGKIYHPEKLALLSLINQKQDLFKQEILAAQWLFISFGSAWVYTLKNSNTIVANCHKIPQQQFEKRLLTIEEIIATWQPILQQIKQLNSAINIVFTVSPVKHLRDGVHENNLSKATLLLAVNELTKLNATYFPAYELVNDDLRDYRFYETDTAHPNTMAIDYIFEKFKTTFMQSNTLQIVSEIEKLNTMQQHKPVGTNAREIKLFEEAKEKQKERVKDLNI